MRPTSSPLSEFLAEVVMTGHYLAEPPKINHDVLHDAEMKCLKIVHDLGPMPMHRLAENMHATKARASQLISTLESHGYAVRNTSEDQRVKLVSATPKGKTVVVTVRAKYVRLAEAIEDQLGAQKAQLLQELLAEITPLNKVQIKTERIQ